MKHGPRKVNVSKVSRAFGLAFTTSLALVVPVNRSEAGVRKSADFVLSRRIVLHLRVLDFANGKSTLIQF